jgi:hypothetical protein
MLVILCLVVVAGHNLLDGIVTECTNLSAVVWYSLHQKQFVMLGDFNNNILG